MRLSRSKILRWRWIVYVLLILWFLPGAWKRWQSSSEAKGSNDAVLTDDLGMPLPSSFHVLPDGTKVPVYELSSEQARKKFGIEQNEANPPPAEPTAFDPATDRISDSDQLPAGETSSSGIQESKPPGSLKSDSAGQDGEKKNGT